MNWFNNYINIAWSFLIHLAKIFFAMCQFQDAKTGKKTHPPNDRFLIKFQLKNAVFGSSERLPPLSGVPPTNKRTPPPISKPQPAAMNFLYACFRLQSIKQWIVSTTTSTLPDLSSSTSQKYFCNVLVSRRQNWKKTASPKWSISN